MNDRPTGPGSAGERLLQSHLGTGDRAASFYDRQVQPQLTAQMLEFIRQQTMVFLSTADAAGNCDTGFRAGPPGFVVALDARTLTYPEYRGNGVHAGNGNIVENPHLGMLFIDFTHHHIGLHVNGTAQVVGDTEQRRLYPLLPTDTAQSRKPALWVHLTVDEAYVQCSKYIPHLEPAPRPRSLTNRPKDGDYFVSPAPDRRRSEYQGSGHGLPARQHERLRFVPDQT
ncbi:pyridoxamine 5'-phosphate oxidase family protein [Streptomyces coelicoflavus]|uniref:pyridoxamine 5'-phosphate oxidase family protein n=1 Tax=Streptomyces TaxID=1883 RepID=UPI000D59DB8C|nr:MULTISPECIES: pyridoxamine 5'-phosphate oxidase family protein [Streptomyces]KAF2780458.1 hydrolase [Streptomyces sp. OM5714]MCX5038165.1 pyridoxamine 5'-phosphate oxidase family protein [Streptomyces coelicoflavus]QFX84246.1 hydrolase [Streptomyces sp. SYP-A7193]